MSGGYVNIGDVQDQHYRYKMPRMVTKVEGRGNGIKTIIVNLVDIAEAINRPPTYITKFFGSELGALSKFDEALQKAIVNGNHDNPTMVELLNSFIRKFVLCGRCKNPETTISVDKHENILLSCKACGADSKVDPREKLATFIVKQPGALKTSKAVKKEVGTVPTEEGREAPAATSTQRKVKSKVETEAEDNDWSEDVSADAVKKRIAEEFKATGGARMDHFQVSDDEEGGAAADAEESEVSPVEVLKAFMKAKPAATSDQVLKAMAKIKKDYELGDKELVCLAHEAFFDKNVDSAQIKKRAPVFKKLVTDESTQKVLIGYTELLLSKHKAIIPKMSVLLSAFYEHDLVDEDTVVAWAKSKKSRYVKDADVLKTIKDAAKPFIDWLKTAEEEDDD